MSKKSSKSNSSSPSLLLPESILSEEELKIFHQRQEPWTRITKRRRYDDYRYRDLGLTGNNIKRNKVFPTILKCKRNFYESSGYDRAGCAKYEQRGGRSGCGLDVMLYFSESEVDSDGDCNDNDDLKRDGSESHDEENKKTNTDMTLFCAGCDGDLVECLEQTQLFRDDEAGQTNKNMVMKKTEITDDIEEETSKGNKEDEQDIESPTFRTKQEERDSIWNSRFEDMMKYISKKHKLVLNKQKMGTQVYRWVVDQRRYFLGIKSGLPEYRLTILKEVKEFVEFCSDYEKELSKKNAMKESDSVNLNNQKSKVEENKKASSTTKKKPPPKPPTQQVTLTPSSQTPTALPLTTSKKKKTTSKKKTSSKKKATSRAPQSPNSERLVVKESETLKGKQDIIWNGRFNEMIEYIGTSSVLELNRTKMGPPLYSWIVNQRRYFCRKTGLTEIRMKKLCGVYQFVTFCNLYLQTTKG